MLRYVAYVLVCELKTGGGSLSRTLGAFELKSAVTAGVHLIFFEKEM